MNLWMILGKSIPPKYIIAVVNYLENNTDILVKGFNVI